MKPGPVDYQLGTHANYRYLGGSRHHGCGERFESKQEAIDVAPKLNRERKARQQKPVRYLLTLTRSSRDRPVVKPDDILKIEMLPPEAIEPHDADANQSTETIKR